MKKNRMHFVAAILVLCAVVVSCASSPYKRMSIAKFPAGSAYSFTGGHDSLLVYLEGSSTGSVLGVREGGKWRSVNFGYYVSRLMGTEFDVLIPERLGAEMGKDYANDVSFLSRYKADEVASSYAAEIDGFLGKHAAYRHVYILGASEGGHLAPLVYSKLSSKDRIDRMVVWGAGGLSQGECFRILGVSTVDMPEDYRRECLKIDSVVADVREHPESVEMRYFGWPYSRWSSFFFYRPIDYYGSIRIPVLFIQGSLDWSSPVESVQYIEKALPDSPFVYRYYRDMGHTPTSGEQMRALLAEIAAWLKS